WDFGPVFGRPRLHSAAAPQTVLVPAPSLGPAGPGKSTAARGLAARLGSEYLATGAMYRAVALGLRRRGIEFDSPAVEAALAELHLQMPPGRVLLNGEDVTAPIRTPAIDAAARHVAVAPAARIHL